MRMMARNTATKMASTTKYMMRSLCSGRKPNKVPRGTPCRPSSPPVNGACNQTKYTICAIASVIMAK